VEAAAAPARRIRVRGVTSGWALAALAFLVAAIAVGIVAGPVEIGLGAVLRSLGEKLGIPGLVSPLEATEETILWDLRVPRVLLAGLVGGMLAVAGATYQGVFHNPLADPYLLGVAAGAGLGATLAIAYLPDALAGREVLPFAAFAGAAVAPRRRAGRERS
jgi:iron complex transport system permease protein